MLIKDQIWLLVQVLNSSCTGIYLDYFDNKEERERQRDQDEKKWAQSYEVGKHSRSLLTLALVLGKSWNISKRKEIFFKTILIDKVWMTSWQNRRSCKHYRPYHRNTSNFVWKLFKVCLPARVSWPEFHCWCETARPCHSPWSGGARCHRQVRTEPLQSLPAESICLLIRQHCNILNMAGTTQHLPSQYNNLNEITSIGNCHHYHYSQAERAWAVNVLSKFWSWNSWPWLQLAALPEVGWSTKSTTFCSAKFELRSLRKKLQNHHIKSYSELFKSSCFLPSSDFALKSFDLRGINWINYLKNWNWSSSHSDWKEFSHESIRTCCLVKSWALQAS